MVTIFFGRLGLHLAAMGLKWPAFALGTVLGAIGASPLRLPSTFLHWFVVIAGVLIILRTIWPWANAALATARHSQRGKAIGQRGAKWFGAAPADRRRPAAALAVRRTRRRWTSPS